jgi:hypothetical protein
LLSPVVLSLLSLLLLRGPLPLDWRGCRGDAGFLVKAVERLLLLLLLLLRGRIARGVAVTAGLLERLSQMRLLQIPASALGMESLCQIAGQHMRRHHHRPAATLGKLLALRAGRCRPVHHRLLGISGRTGECSRRSLRWQLPVHSGILEGGILLEALVLAGILALELPCLALAWRPLVPLRARCALGRSVDVLHELAGGLGRGHVLALLLGAGHGGVRRASLRRGAGLLLGLLLAGSAFGVVISGGELLGGQAQGGAKGGSAADRGQAYERRGPVDAIGAELLLVLVLLLVLCLRVIALRITARLR